MFSGTGSDEDIELHVVTPAFPTGGSNVQIFTALASLPAWGVVGRVTVGPFAIPAGITELAFSILMGAFVGTAGADDSWTISNVKLEIGNIATHYRKPFIADEMIRCLRRYQKTFLQATVPAQNIGVGNGEFVANAAKAGTVSMSLGTLGFDVHMRIPQAVTFFNPAAANGQVRDLTAGADCSATAAQNVTESACEIVTTGNASTAVEDRLGLHLVLDARL